MKQDSSLTRSLSDAQENHVDSEARERRSAEALAFQDGYLAGRALRPDVDAPAPAFNATKTIYRLYTQYLPHVDAASYVGRYFAGATVYRGLGLDARTQADSENAIIIEIVSSAPDSLQRVLNLAGDLRFAGQQISVLVTVQEVRTFEVTEAEPTRLAGGRLLDRATDSPRYNRASKAQAHRFADVG